MAMAASSPLRGPTIHWSDNALALDHGDLPFEAGLTLDNVPKITFKYEHTFREGDAEFDQLGICAADGQA